MCSSLSSTSTWTRPSPPWHDVPGRELQATADALERSRDGLGKFSGVFRDVADAREGGCGASLARYHLGENVRALTRSSQSGSRMPRRPSGAMCATRYWLVEKREADYQVSVR
jgi:hypothetical protein